MIGLYVSVLLIIRLISMGLLVSVIKKQLKLFKLPVEDETLLDTIRIQHFRSTLFIMAFIIFIGNLIPAILDVLTIFMNHLIQTNTAYFIYTIVNNITALASSYLIWKLYRIANNEKAKTDKIQLDLEQDLKISKRKERK